MGSAILSGGKAKVAVAATFVVGLVPVEPAALAKANAILNRWPAVGLGMD